MRFTGHRLGGALAMPAGCRMYLEEPRLQADGICTYGQPRTCDRLLTASCDKTSEDRLHRAAAMEKNLAWRLGARTAEAPSGQARGRRAGGGTRRVSRSTSGCIRASPGDGSGLGDVHASPRP
ncbi:hypothetical protein [Streptomyces sp. NPDC056194]|uniref:lipase family protein n=1 Tax=unclassified Streptomyces TaxID=2593676 RepID=UPI0035D68708